MEYHIRITDHIQSFENAVDVKQFDSNGTTIDKFSMSLEDLINSLLDAREKYKTYTTPFLPQNCVRYEKGEDMEYVYVELPKRQWKVKYREEDMMIGFPRLLVQYVVREQTVISMVIYAVKEKEVLSKETALQHFPFTNVEHSTGKVCMGSNTFPEIKGLQHLEKLHFIFFAAPFGEDYGFRVASKVGSQEKLFKQLENQDFDDDLLLPTGETIENRFPM